MKTKIFSFVLAVLFISSMNVTAQDVNSSNYDAWKRNQVFVPDANVNKVPVAQYNSIPFLSNGQTPDRPTCLFEPFDSATWTIAMARNDDGSSVSIALPFTFNLYGDLYTSVYINNNGNITFTSPYSTFTPFAFPSSPLAIVAPFFADVDTRNTLSGLVYYKMESNRMTITWDSVGYYNAHVDKRNTFQLIISDGTDPYIGIGNNVCFSYGDMNWTTGDASLGIGGFGPPSTAATLGVNKGDGTTFATLGRFCRDNSNYYGPGADTNGVHYLDCRGYCFNASNAGNICPVPSGFPGTAPVNVTCGTTYVGHYSMSAPEATQLVSGSVSGVPPNMTVNITNGLTCTFDVTYAPTAGDVGVHIVCFQGVDNFTPPCTTTVCVTYIVDCPGPVELTSFTSTVTNRDVTLNWSTATETNNSGFDIERSGGNNEWTKVGFVTGHGTVTVPQSYSFTDRGLASGVYNYRLKQIDFNGNFEYFNLSNEVIIGTPTTFSLKQNYPNPFNPSTKIEYAIPFDGKVSLSIFDMSGKEISKLVNGTQTAGYYSVNFDGTNLASGVYYYRIEVSGQNNFVDTRKMLLVK